MFFILAKSKKKNLKKREKMVLYTSNYTCAANIKRGAAAQSVERTTPDEEALGSIPTVATRTLLVGSVLVKCDRLRQKSWSARPVSCVTATKIVRRQSWDPSEIYPNQPNRQGNIKKI